MTLDEFVKIDPNIIRRDNELMQLYIKFYEAAFSFVPNCSGCSFKSGFKKLKHYAIYGEKNIIFDKNTIEMKTTKSFQLKKQYLTKILTYVKNGTTHRKYGNQLTEEFAIALVEAGKGDLFHTLPKDSKKVKDIEVAAEEVKAINYDAMDYRKDVLPLYAQVKERTGNKAESNKKADIIKFLQDNES